MTVADVCAAIERLAPSGLAYSWDRAGLSLGDPRAGVEGVLAALTVTRGAFEAARRARANLIVSHHPLLWEPLRALRFDDAHTVLCLDLAAARIACYAAHTNLDVTPGGVNTVLAERLGLRNLLPLLPVEHASQVKLVTFVPESHLAPLRDAVCAAGAGVIGEYSHCSFSAPGTGTFLPGANARPYSGVRLAVNEEPERRFEVLVTKARLAGVLEALRAAHPYEEPACDIVALENRDSAVSLGLRGELPRPVTLERFAKHVCTALETAHVRMVGSPRQRVRAVAVLGGSGGGEAATLPAGVDVLVTGDVRYHDALAARDKGLALIDAGHAATEKWVVPVLSAHLKAFFPRLRVTSYIEPELFHVVST